ncbi:hypothetical protein THRCLA_07137 [Thraustotheca clavata]|uniref:EF-hand domain-containing protein n=1 Tax=Thraustotheca clavata TaxID=74557 RepID=A0A1V9ZGC4_9STRA|nr:hypothetical protein THRCLA_07137 [Thraustotheca clavata]
MQAQADIVTVDVIQAVVQASNGFISLASGVQIWKCLVDGIGHYISPGNSIRLEQFVAFEINSSGGYSFVDLAFTKSKANYLPKLSLSHAAAILEMDLKAIETFVSLLVNTLEEMMQRNNQTIRLGFLPLGEWYHEDGFVSFLWNKEYIKPKQSKLMNKRLQTPCPSKKLSRSNSRPTTAMTTASTIKSHHSNREMRPSTAQYQKSRHSNTTRAALEIPQTSQSAKSKCASVLSAKSTNTHQYQEIRPRTVQSQKSITSHHSSSGKQSNQMTIKRPTTSASIKSSYASKPIADREIHNTRRPTTSSRAYGSNQSRQNTPSVKSSQRPMTAKSQQIQQRQMQNTRSATRQTNVKQLLLSRSGSYVGIHTLSRTMRALDVNRDGRLSRDELYFGLRDFGIDCNSSEMDILMQAFDKDGDGSISFDEFLVALRGDISPRRLAIIQLAFRKLDANGDGVVTLVDICELYDVSKHPAFLSGEKSKDDILSEFMEQWDTDQKDGIITLDEFDHYYQNISASIDDDTYFELMIRNAWHISGGTGQAENSANKRILIEDSDGNQRVVEADESRNSSSTTSLDDIYAARLTDPIAYIKANIFAPPCSIDSLAQRLGANRVLGNGQERIHIKAFAIALCKRDKRLSSRDATAITRAIDTAGSEIIDIPHLHGMLKTRFGASIKSDSGNNGSILDRLKAKIIARGGATGIHAIQRVMRIWDDHGDGKLTKDELKDGLETFGIEVYVHEVDQLMTLLDTDHSGTISFDELLVGLRGELNPRREALVELAYQQLDANSNGQVTLDDIRMSFDVKHHPDVVAGRLSERDALVQFMNHWDANQDGVVALDEFKMYYKNVSASIDGDDYFELMIRNAWHISGGQGQCANTSNKRVIVTKADGSQTVEEIKNDLRVRSRKGMMDNLAKQNISNISDITLKGTYIDARSKTAKQSAIKSRRERENDALEMQAKRNAAAITIQKNYRCHRAQKFAICVRRKLAAERQHKAQLQREKAKAKSTVLRPALRSYHGF